MYHKCIQIKLMNEMPKRGDIYSVLSWKKIKETETSQSEYVKKSERGKGKKRKEKKRKSQEKKGKRPKMKKRIVKKM